MKKLKFFVILSAIIGALFLFGACGTGGTLSAPTNFDINEEDVLTWSEVKNVKVYYVEVLDATTEQLLKEGRERDEVYDLSDFDEGDYFIRVRAMGDGKTFQSSEWSELISFHKDYENRCLYKLINSRTEYELTRFTTRTPKMVLVEGTYLDKPVTRIADNAFFNSSIEEVEIRKNIKEIGHKAFQSCVKLKKVTLPVSLKSIGLYAFNSCRSLAEINIPADIERIEDFTFSYCIMLDEINLPEKLEYIGAEAFIGCSKLKTLVIPDFVQTIGEDAFAGLNSMETLTIGSGLKVISESAFYSCESLKTVTFSDENNVKTIETSAFKETGLESITLPEGLESIGDEAFKDCEVLATVKLPQSLNKMGEKVFTNTVLFNNQIESGFVYVDKWLTQVSIAKNATLKYLGSMPASQDPDKCHVFPEGTVGLAAKVFQPVSSTATTTLLNVTLPASMKYISEYAFAKCSNLRYFLASESGLVAISDRAFSESALNVMELPEGLESIGAYAFYKSNVVNVEGLIPESVKSIGTYAFYKTKLWNDAEPNAVVYADNWVVGYKGSVTGVVLNSGTKGISDYAFYQSSVTGVANLDKVTIIGRGAFYECADLGVISLANKLTRIEDYAFYKSGLLEITLRNELEYIGRSAFYACNNLTKIDMAKTKISSIGDYAFYRCEYLQEFSLPTKGSWDIKIGNYAFYKCMRLESVALPDNVVSVGEKCFYKCTALQSVTIGNGLKEIGDYMFSGCSALEMIVLSDGVEEIGNYAFYKATGLRLLSLGRNVKSIGNYAFYGAENLSRLYIPESVSYVGKYAFKGCTALQSVTVSANVLEMGSHVFYGCSNATIYSDCAKKPDGWNKRWNSSYRSVVWGCTLSDDGSYVTQVTIQENTLENVKAESAFAAPIRSDKQFKCWATAPVEVEAEKTYLATEIVNAPVGVTLYAIWK